MKVYKGETVAGGVALGRIHLRGFDTDEVFALRIPTDEIENELNRLREALDESRRQIEELKTKHGDDLGKDELRIFDAHLTYLADPLFIDEIEKLVMQEAYSVKAAIRKVMSDYDRIFQLVEDDYLRQRAGDFRDIAIRLMRNLDELAGEQPLTPAPEGDYVLAARKLSVSDLFKLDNERVAGIVTEEGGISSHAGILARSMGIPTITGIPDLPTKVQNDDFVVVDAQGAELVVDPDDAAREEFTKAAQRLDGVTAARPDADTPHQTRDGTAIELLATCGNAAEVGLATSFGMDGVGLFRTEQPFLGDGPPPTEDELVAQYQEVARQPGNVPVAFRLLDVTAKSSVPELPVGAEKNPALGMRGVRGLLQDGRVLRRQLRAILRASAKATHASILVPFVTVVSDIQRIKAAVIEERLELRKAKVPCADTIDLAPILEVPAAVFVLPAILRECDYVVVSLDDLKSMLLAADRDNRDVRAYYESYHPALFEVLTRIRREAEKLDKKVVLFGEGAADPLLVPFYVGIGIRALSVAPVRVAGIMQVLRRFTTDECAKIADELLQAPRALDVQRILLRAAGASS